MKARGSVLIIAAFLASSTFWRTTSEVVGAREDPMVRGLAVYANDDEGNYPVLVRDSINGEAKPVRFHDRLTIQFDVMADEPPALKIRFLHCNRDWVPDDNLFVNDVTHSTSFYLDYRTSPAGVQNYRYRYTNKFPDGDDAVRFDYSGNWVFRIVDAREATLYAEGRFFVVDKVAPTKITVLNEYLTANTSPFNQIHKVLVNVTLPREIDGYYYTTVDVYQNRRVFNSYRIDANDRDPYTFVEGLGTGSRTFSISNILPGNEYRTLDISNANRYPNRSLVRLVEGADQPRLFWRTGSDRDGRAVLNRYGGMHSDYLEVMFRLDLTQSELEVATRDGRQIFVVGQFNQWNPRPEDKLSYDEGEHALVVTKLLRRGIYDYQYITGIWNRTTSVVEEQDWGVLEGNDWRTKDSYWAFVYFRDPRYGGFDRIVGFARGSSAPSIRSSN